MPRPKQIEKYTPPFVISSVRERSRILTEAVLSKCEVFKMTRKQIFVMTPGDNGNNPAS
ncbi:MAG: hypothetical protein ACREOW_12225 [Thermodesulfobacteriota bacterium]